MVPSRIFEYLSPRVKQRRLLQEDYSSFKEDVVHEIFRPDVGLGDSIRLIDLVKERREQYTKPRGTKEGNEFRDIRNELDLYAESLFLRAAVIYIEKVLKHDQSALEDLRQLKEIINKSREQISLKIPEIYYSLTPLSEYLRIENVEEESQFMAEVRKDVLENNFGELGELLTKKHYRDQIIELFRHSAEYFDRIVLLLNNLGLMSDRIESYSRSIIKKSGVEAVAQDHFKRLENINEIIRKDLVSALYLQKSKNHPLFAVLEQGYAKLMQFVGEDFAGHGTYIGSAKHHLKHGFPTGGQGGANFLVNGVLGQYGIGEGKCFLITKIKYLLHEAAKNGAIVEIIGASHLDDSKEIILEPGKRQSIVLEVMKKRQTYEEVELDKFLTEKKGCILRVRKGDDVKLKLPLVVVTDDVGFYSYVRETHPDAKIVCSGFNDLEIKGNAAVLCDYLMATQEGRKILNRYF